MYSDQCWFPGPGDEYWENLWWGEAPLSDSIYAQICLPIEVDARSASPAALPSAILGFDRRLEMSVNSKGSKVSDCCQGSEILLRSRLDSALLDVGVG